MPQLSKFVGDKQSVQMSWIHSFICIYGGGGAELNRENECGISFPLFLSLAAIACVVCQLGSSLPEPQASLSESEVSGYELEGNTMPFRISLDG